ncbi:MAG: hypothetical protein U0X73_09130 [Thermoanaerobaculia bacterium]
MRILRSSRPWLVLALLAAAGIALGRGAEVLDPAAIRHGAGESGWFAWSRRHGDLAPAFATARARLAAGDPVLVVVEPGEDLGWWRVMALYYLPQQEIVDVVPQDEARRFPRDLARLFVRLDGSVTLVEPRARERRTGE